MILLLIQIYILGALITLGFRNKLPSSFLALVSPLVGIVGYAANTIILLVIGSQITIANAQILLCVELIGLLVFLLIVNKGTLSIKGRIPWLWMIVGVAFLGLVLFFREFNFTFGSNDTLYMIIMTRDILTTGFSQWHFASPAGMGVLVPSIQTIQMLFGEDYTWFIQPIISIDFYALFIYFCFRSLRKANVKTIITLAIMVAIIAATLSSNFVLVFTTYIHTNFISAIFFFLFVISALKAVQEENNHWLFFSTFFLTAFCFSRVENIFYAAASVLIFLSVPKSSTSKMKIFFIPSFLIQFFWYWKIYLLKADTFTDQMSPNLILFTLVGIAAMMLILIFSDWKPVALILYKLFQGGFWIVLLLAAVGLLIFQPEKTMINITTNFINLFFTGNWSGMWWLVMIWFFISAIYFPKVPQERVFLLLIGLFFITILILGSYRSPYHINWSDSANRMNVHVLPVFLYFLVAKLGEWNQSTQILSIQNKPGEEIHGAG